MQFIEGIFGIAPDGGSGALELLLLALPCAAWLAFRIARPSRRSVIGADHCTNSGTL